MGTRLENWLSKANNANTRKQWKIRWMQFARWVTSTPNPLTGTRYMSCNPDDVDDVIRADFETMPSHLFHDRYRDLLTKYVASLADRKSNTALSLVSSVRSFFTNEATSIKLQNGKVPRAEMAMGEHRFTQDNFRSMWLVANTEGKARLSTAVSLGWSIGDFINLRAAFVQDLVRRADVDGFVAFDYRRHKTKARVRGILTPNAVTDLTMYLKRVPMGQERLWTTRTTTGLNDWLRRTCQEAGITKNGRIRFHLIRKYTFDLASAQCGTYEAKLLVGKTISLSDATYLHGLEDRLLERYKQFAYPFLNISGGAERGPDLSHVAAKLDGYDTTIQVLTQRTQQQDLANRELTARLAKVELEHLRDLTALRDELEEQRQLVGDLKRALGNMERLLRHTVGSK